MHCKPVVTRHFAERFIERYGDRRLLKKIRDAVQDHYCEHVFDCLVYGLKQRIDVEGVKVCVLFDETKKKLVLTTIY